MKTKRVDVMKVSNKVFSIYEKRNIESCIAYYFDSLTIFNNSSKILRKTFIRKCYTKYLDFLIKIKLKFFNKVSLPFLDHIITTRCSLKCEKCCSLMPTYTEQTHFDETFDDFKQHLDNISPYIYIYIGIN